jgi:hypothetical protein
MSQFLAPLRVEEIEGDDCRWRLLEPCVYHLKELNGPEWVMAGKGFETDFGSIPRFLWWLPSFHPNGRFRRAYVIHDKLYQEPVILNRSAEGVVSVRICHRDEADEILLEAITVLGANWVAKRLIYRGVRLGGWHAWNKHRSQKPEADDDDAA